MRYDGSEKVVLNKISFLYVISPNKNSSIFSIKSDTLPIRIPLNLRVGLFALNLRAAYKIKFQVKKMEKSSRKFHLFGWIQFR